MTFSKNKNYREELASAQNPIAAAKFIEVGFRGCYLTKNK
jgi:hypothetical protein